MKAGMSPRNHRSTHFAGLKREFSFDASGGIEIALRDACFVGNDLKAAVALLSNAGRHGDRRIRMWGAIAEGWYRVRCRVRRAYRS